MVGPLSIGVWDVGCQSAHQLGGSEQGDINILVWMWRMGYSIFKILEIFDIPWSAVSCVYKEYLNEILTTDHEHQNSCLEDLNIHDKKRLERIVCDKS